MYSIGSGFKSRLRLKVLDPSLGSGSQLFEPMDNINNKLFYPKS
jgi:hypothetical protein